LQRQIVIHPLRDCARSLAFLIRQIRTVIATEQLREDREALTASTRYS